MIAKVAWIGALFALAVLTSALQLDRQSEAVPALAAMVPEPLRGYAQAQLAASAIQDDKPELALAEAQRLIRRRPVPAENLTLLAAAQAKASQSKQAAMTIQIAAQRGWREPLSQEAVLRLALAAGDEAEAARRYTALFLRSATADALLRDLGPQVLNEADGVGQRTMVDIISGGDRWQSAFLRRGAQVMPAEAFAQVTISSIARGTRFDCTVLSQATKQVAQRDPASAARIRNASRERCPGRSS